MVNSLVACILAALACCVLVLGPSLCGGFTLPSVLLCGTIAVVIFYTADAFLQGATS